MSCQQPPIFKVQVVADHHGPLFYLAADHHGALFYLAVDHNGHVIIIKSPSPSLVHFLMEQPSAKFYSAISENLISNETPKLDADISTLDMLF